MVKKTMEDRFSELEKQLAILKDPHGEIKRLKKELAVGEKLREALFNDYAELCFAVCGAHYGTSHEDVLKIAEYHKQICKQQRA